MSADEFVRALRIRAREEVRAAHEACVARRERVLRYPDLAKRLTEPPLNIPTPEMWTGYVPPARGPWGGSDGFGDVKVVANNSPARAVLVEISAEALRRDQDSQTSADASGDVDP